MANEVNLKEWSDKRLQLAIPMMENAASRLRGQAASKARNDIKLIKAELESRGIKYEDPYAPPSFADFL